MSDKPMTLDELRLYVESIFAADLDGTIRLGGTSEVVTMREIRDDISRALAALPAHGVRIKPLVWEPSVVGKPWHSAKAPWGWYYAQWDDETQAWFASLEMGEVEHPIILQPSDVATLDAAKAAAQADYEARILAALDAPQPDADDPECTDCGGTGITYQTERRCACQPAPQAEAHDEQLGVWADELMADLVLNDLMDLVDHEYDTKVGARRKIIKALAEANQAKVPQTAKEPCGECYLPDGETCDICGAIGPSQKAIIRKSQTVAPHPDAVDALVKAAEKLGLRKLVAGWNGEGRDKPYKPHPPQLGATIKTTCGVVYEIDAALAALRAKEGGE